MIVGIIRASSMKPAQKKWLEDHLKKLKGTLREPIFNQNKDQFQKKRQNYYQ